MTNVLFVCVANCGRSVIAERLFRMAAGDEHAARSAGSEPGKGPSETILQALREVGVDASDHVPHRLDAQDLAWAEVAVAVCADEVCPVTPGVESIRWKIEDPKGLPIEQVRTIRDEIGGRVKELVAELPAS
jgi:arsenate reductase